MVARDGVEQPTPVFSAVLSALFSNNLTLQSGPSSVTSADVRLASAFSHEQHFPRIVRPTIQEHEIPLALRAELVNPCPRLSKDGTGVNRLLCSRLFFLAGCSNGRFPVLKADTKSSSHRRYDVY